MITIEVTILEVPGGTGIGYEYRPGTHTTSAERDLASLVRDKIQEAMDENSAGSPGFVDLEGDTARKHIENIRRGEAP